MSDYEHLIYEQRGPVAIITINRPERMNALGRRHIAS
jgi:enoyl-CoA hydratase